jgi:serralysin
MFGVATSAKTTTPSFDLNVNGLLTGSQWTNPTLSYSFTDSFSNDYEYGYSEPGLSGSYHSYNYRSLNSTQKSVFRTWADAYSSVSNLDLYELTGTSDRDATIRVANSYVYGSTAQGQFPSSYYTSAGDIFFSTGRYDTPSIGNLSYFTFGHELGHTLGLKHPHDSVAGSTTMTSDRDSMEFSIMSYRSYENAYTGGYSVEQGSYAQSLMMYDISAIQQMYGAWFGSNASNTTYTFSTTTGEMFINGVGQGTSSTNTIFRTIWDGNGTDTYNFSNYSTNLWVDLTPGSWSDLDRNSDFQAANLGNGRYAKGEIYNALQYYGDSRSLIENATGGSGYDVMIGNIANNLLYGGDGNDYIYGAEGNDVIYGDAGADTMIGGTGNDIFVVDNTSDVVTETSTIATEIDTVYSAVDYRLVMNVEQLVLYGTSDIKGAGNSLDNIIVGNSGANVLDGGAGNDTLLGGYGNDYLFGGYGADWFYFANKTEGGDTIGDFAVGTDKIGISAAGFGGGLISGSTVNASQFLTVTTGATAITSSQRFIYNSTFGELFFDADGYGSSSAVWIASLSYTPNLSATDLYIV